MKHRKPRRGCRLSRFVGSGIGAILTGGIFVGGCATPSPITNLSAAYEAALSSSTEIEPPPPGSEAERRGIQGVKDLFEVYSAESITNFAGKTYAETLYFRDGFKELTNREDIVHYMLEGTKPLRACTFRFDQVSRSDNDFYFRWVMIVSLQSDPEGYQDEAVGMSHIRFNKQGQVVFQQDYWDPTDVLYRRIPIANGLIKRVKDRL